VQGKGRRGERQKAEGAMGRRGERAKGRNEGMKELKNLKI
jgi:hypothetical protein